jgi:hypothetical protein
MIPHNDFTVFKVHDISRRDTKELKTAKVVVIGKPGKKDMSNPMSYRCISMLSNIANLTEKAVAQYLT